MKLRPPTVIVLAFLVAGCEGCAQVETNRQTPNIAETIRHEDRLLELEQGGMVGVGRLRVLRQLVQEEKAAKRGYYEAQAAGNEERYEAAKKALADAVARASREPEFAR